MRELTIDALVIAADRAQARLDLLCQRIEELNVVGDEQGRDAALARYSAHKRLADAFAREVERRKREMQAA